MKNKLISLDSKKIYSEAFKNLNEEIVTDQIRMVRDYLKGALRLKRDLQKEIEAIEAKIVGIDEAMELMQAGDMSKIKDIGVPAKYLSEETVRLNDVDWRE
jgi:hypothetical protein